MLMTGLLAAASGQLDVMLKKSVATKTNGFVNGMSAGSPHRYGNGMVPAIGIHINANGNGLHA